MYECIPNTFTRYITHNTLTLPLGTTVYIQLGEFSNPNGEVLEKGQIFRLDSDPTKGNNLRVQLPHPEIIKASEIGHVLLIDDGKVKLVVSQKGIDYLDCTVVVAGKVKDRKGVNTPDSVLELSPLTKKDRADLTSMLQMGVDWVALSFVQTPADIVEINQLIDMQLPKNAFKPAIMAKIEKPSCFFDNNLEEIVHLCNGIMVARGDVRIIHFYISCFVYVDILRCFLKTYAKKSISNVFRLYISFYFHSWVLNAHQKTYQYYKNKLSMNVVSKVDRSLLLHKC
jgi:hypothetical protein